MIRAILFAALLLFTASASARSENGRKACAVLLIPYNPTMHLSDSDQDIAMASGTDIGDMRQQMREELLIALNQRFAEVHDVKMPARNFVTESNSDIDHIYHSLYYDQQKTFPAIYPSKFKHYDTTLYVSRTAKKHTEDQQYIHSGLRDHHLLKDLAEKYSTNYFIFLNEIDIKTHYDDCINLSLKIYSRDVKVHYSIYDVSGKLIYGDVAVVHFPSSTNSVREISAQTFPHIARQIFLAFDAVVRQTDATSK